MHAQLPALTLVLTIGALAAAGHAVLQKHPAAGDVDPRLEVLEARLDRLPEARGAYGPRNGLGPFLRGRHYGDSVSAGSGASVRIEAAPQDPGAMAESSDATRKGSEDPERIQELVEASVEKKAAQLQVLSNRKPSIDLFAKTLELTEGQRFEVEQEVIRGQHELYALLETPTADGTIPLDDLVEVMAYNLTDPEQARRQWAGFLGRVLSERVPGTGATYALRAETVKGAVRERLRRTLTEKQYATFQAWRLDPTEIKEIDGNPWTRLDPRVLDRAEALRAETPDRE